MNGSNGYAVQSRNISEASTDPRRGPPGSASSAPAMSRADRFEDEKRRMIESCFAKVDANGQLSESYITHIRVQEDAAHPSSPPPPNSSPNNKKPRIVVIAVRSTGRVRMHKARENNNASFSIGKTWNLEDLSAIESYSHPSPNASPQQEQIREWAGPVGFLVTISKPYYWQAGTAKEKDFFIASLVKIYRKYTKGQIPELKGFSDKELEAMLGMLPAGQSHQRPATDSRSAMTAAVAQRPPTDPRAAAAAAAAATPPRPPFAEQQRAGSSDSREGRQRAVSKDRHRPSPDAFADPAPRRQMLQDPRQRYNPDHPPQHDPHSVPVKDQQRQPRRYGSREQGMRQDPSRERMARPSQEQLRPPPSREMMRPPPGQFAPPARPPPPGARLTPKSSKSELRQPRSKSPAPSNMSASSRGHTPQAQPPAHQTLPLQSVDRQRSYQSIQSAQSAEPAPQPLATDGAAFFNATVDRWKPQQPQPTQQPNPPQQPRQDDVSPQRQRPRQLEDLPKPLHLRDPPSGETSRNFSYEVQAPPERRRPLMSTRDYTSAQRSDSDSTELRPPPLSTSRNVSGGGARPQSPLATEPQSMPGTFYETPSTSSTNIPAVQASQEAEILDASRAESLSDEAVPARSVPAETAPVPVIEAPSNDIAAVLSDTESEESHRPGLGPMIKSKKPKAELANAFRKAAAAHGAFKPRAGGAGERLAKGGFGREPDGINAVVPAPLRKMSVDPDQTEAPPSPLKETPSAPVIERTEAAPKLEVPSPLPSPLPRETTQDEPSSVQLSDEPVAHPLPAQPEVQLAPAPEPRRPKRRSVHQENYLRSLDIDPRLLDGRGLEFETILTDFGWGANVLKGRQLEDLEADLKRELGRIEAGSWLGHLEQKDDRVEVVDQMLDRAIAECDELEGLLTLYAVELGSLNDDIAFIEAQSQGLQVQTANQKVLHAELHKLVDTISITTQQLRALRQGDFSTPYGLSDIESALLLLYKAMITIDPKIRSSNTLSSPDLSRTTPGLEGIDIGNMHALQEKRQAYLQESNAFCQRLLKHLDASFQGTLGLAKPALTRSPSGIGSSFLKLNGHAYNAARESLWQFSPLLLYTKEVNQPAWQTLIRAYYSRARPLYTEVLRENLRAWKNNARKPTTEDTDLLFTSAEKATPEGLTSTARRITVKRSQTLAKTFRTTSGDKTNPSELKQVGRAEPYQAFAGILEEQIPLLSMEQNFIVGIFHATSLENIDFADAVTTSAPAARIGQDLSTRRLMEPDRNMARLVSDVMEELFGFWPTEMRTLMEWTLADSPIQGVAVLTTLAVQAAQLQETSQEYVLHTINSMSQRLASVFQKTVDEQVRAIEDTKVKISKRKGVIAFMKIFPMFSNAVETMYHGAAGRADGTTAVLGARQIIDDMYVRINKAMWDSLKVIARESPTAGVLPSGPNADSEREKEFLNYDILLIENMHHYIEEVDDGGKEGSVLAEWKAKALMDRAEHMDQYVSKVVGRPLGKVIEWVEKAEGYFAQRMSGPTVVAQHPHSYSRSAAKKVLAAHDSKEIRKSIEALRKRIEKHFGESDEEQLSRQLVGLVYKECERRYDQVLDRLQRACKELYKEEEKRVDIEWSKEDNKAGFR